MALMPCATKLDTSTTALRAISREQGTCKVSNAMLSNGSLNAFLPKSGENAPNFAAIGSYNDCSQFFWPTLHAPCSKGRQAVDNAADDQHWAEYEHGDDTQLDQSTDLRLRGRQRNLIGFGGARQLIDCAGRAHPGSDHHGLARASQRPGSPR